MLAKGPKVAVRVLDAADPWPGPRPGGVPGAGYCAAGGVSLGISP